MKYSNLSLTTLLEIVAEPENKRTLSMTEECLKILESSRYRSGKSSLNFLTVHESSVLHAFALTPFDPFFEQFDEKIQTLIEAGTCPYRMNGEIVEYGGKNDLYDEEVPPLVLSMDDLGIGFIVCVIPLALSVFVFFIEVMIPISQNFVHKVKDSIIAVAAIAVFMNFEVRIL